MFPSRYYVLSRETGELKILSKPNGTVKHVIPAKDIHYVRISDILDSKNTAKSVKNTMTPIDFPFLFLVQTSDRTYYLYAATAAEREIWVHDFSNFMAHNKDTPLNSVRSAVKEKIDPFESMEVMNLSQHCMLLS